MASGLLALFDDVSALVKASAASLDDVPAQVSKTSGKVSGIVIDDTAVTPKYVVGLDPKREIAIIFQIAKKSLINKVLLLSPAALLLGFFAPWAITPILMLGGAFLCFEGYEKVHSMFHKPQLDTEDPADDQVKTMTPEELEKERVKGAVRTDLILSAEIVAITYYTVADDPLVTQIIVMLSVALLITVAVYGFVGLIVKADDFGIYLTQKRSSSLKKLGRGVVRFMPHFLKFLSYVGTAAMLWVGGEIVAHGIPFTNDALYGLGHALEFSPALGWLAKVVASAFGGLILGFVVERIVVGVKKVMGKR